MASLVDTNVVVYRYDPRFPIKQEIARNVLRRGLEEGGFVLAHQTVLEFVASTTRPRADLNGSSLLEVDVAHREAEGLLLKFPVLYPDEAVLTAALRGAAMYRLSWYDAHLWAYAEVNGIPEILSEDFQHGRHYGSVRVVDPFLAASDEVHELPAMYDEADSRTSVVVAEPFRADQV